MGDSVEDDLWEMITCVEGHTHNLAASLSKLLQGSRELREAWRFASYPVAWDVTMHNYGLVKLT